MYMVKKNWQSEYTKIVHGNEKIGNKHIPTVQMVTS